MNAPEAIPERWAVRYDMAKGINAQVPGLLVDFKECVEELGAAEAALVGIMELVDQGILCRNTENDSEPGWSLRQIPLIKALKAANEVLTKCLPKGAAK